MSLYGLLVFSAVYLLAVASPGPGVAAVIARSLAKGTRGAPAFIAGFLVGNLIWFAFAATGLAALAQSAQAVFVVVKYAGAAYLLYLAYKLWTAPPAPIDATVELERGQQPLQLFLGSLALALLPTVVPLERLTWVAVVEIAVAISIVLPVTLGAYVLLAARARRVFKSATAVRRIHRGTGAAMACAAVAVATR